MNAGAPVIIPRWEWRTFAPSFGNLRARLGGVAFDAPRQASEIYLLCSTSSHNAKIRGESLQLKWRKQVDAKGLELWDPILRSPFPLAGEFIVRLLEVWGIGRPPLGLEPLELAGFLADIVGRTPALQAVQVQKRHEGFAIQGARCKFTRITGPTEPFESFCIEHEDPEIVMQVIRELGLETRENINYPKGLKQALGLNPTP